MLEIVLARAANLDRRRAGNPVGPGRVAISQSDLGGVGEARLYHALAVVSARSGGRNGTSGPFILERAAGHHWKQTASPSAIPPVPDSGQPASGSGAQWRAIARDDRGTSGRGRRMAPAGEAAIRNQRPGYESGTGRRVLPTNPPRTCQVQSSRLLLLLGSTLLRGLLLSALLLCHFESPPRSLARSLRVPALRWDDVVLARVTAARPVRDPPREREASQVRTSSRRAMHSSALRSWVTTRYEHES